MTPSASASSPGKTRPDLQTSEPWWRHGMVWLVIGGPLAVVVAGVVTAVIAWKGADEVLVDSRSVGAEAGRQGPRAETPAMLARNHAATAGAQPPAASDPKP